MKVIEGRSGKSLVLQGIINNHTGKILMLDSVNPKHIVAENLDICSFGSSQEIWGEFKEYEFAMFNDIHKIITESGYTMIVLEVNDKPDMVTCYKDMEDSWEIPCIVTIQNNDLDEIKVYEV
jgi:hypothetical protein